jgi:hypothetical protein
MPTASGPPAYAQPAYAPGAYGQAAGPSSNRRTIIIAAIAGGVILVAGIVILIVLLSGGGGGSSSPSQAVRSLIDAQLRGDTDAFIGYFTKADRDAIAREGAASRQQIDAVVKQAANRVKTTGNPEVNIKKEQVNGDTATVDFEVKWKDGDANQATLNLIKEDGSWRIKAPR